MGVNLFHYWDDVIENNTIDDEQISNVNYFYELFRRELILDLPQSARIQHNGLDTLVSDMIRWMYRAHPTPVSADVAGICE